MSEDSDSFGFSLSDGPGPILAASSIVALRSIRHLPTAQTPGGKALKETSPAHSDEATADETIIGYFGAEKFREAQRRIASSILPTRLVPFSPQALPNAQAVVQESTQILLKCEDEQVAGSFKIRGACNALLEALGQGAEHIVTRSSGNFGKALATLCKERDVPLTVVLSENHSPTKRKAIERLGANLEVFGSGIEESTEYALRLAETLNARFLHPFDDPHTVLGQGTVALELLDAIEEDFTLLCPLGGGGLLSGCAAALKQARPNTRVIGVEPEGASDYAFKRQKGRDVPFEGSFTIADGLRALFEGEHNLPLLDHYVDEVWVVSDMAIKMTMRTILEETGKRIEPSGAASVAALCNQRAQTLQGTVVCILSGGNICDEHFAEVTRIS